MWDVGWVMGRGERQAAEEVVSSGVRPRGRTSGAGRRAHTRTSLKKAMASAIVVLGGSASSTGICICCGGAAKCDVVVMLSFGGNIASGAIPVSKGCSRCCAAGPCASSPPSSLTPTPLAPGSPGAASASPSCASAASGAGGAPPSQLLLEPASSMPASSPRLRDLCRARPAGPGGSSCC